MTLTQTKPYEAKTYVLTGLDGISEKQLEEHFKLYAGYVNNSNTLYEKIAELIAAGKVGTPEYAELKRRLGFEVNGVVLHDYYFANLKANGGAVNPTSKLGEKLTQDFGSVDAWQTDFINTGLMRGIGWAVLYQDLSTGRLQNFWISDHEYGHPAGFAPVLVMDVWEHAYVGDFKPTERKLYIESFFKNINWQVAESRLK